MATINPPGLPGSCREYVVSVHDTVEPELAEHTGAAYTSPRQSAEQALALLALLLGAAPPIANGRVRWTRAIAGGQRTITLTPVDDTTEPSADPSAASI
jgi:hypothetical protein